VNERLTSILQRSFLDVLSVAQRHGVNMRIAAYMLAMERVAAVHRLRGLYA
jgi:glutamate dehydrogenase (NAD(P)+)